MQDEDATGIDPSASADGIVRCLRMLADEAAGLNLSGTLQALHRAIAVCEGEGGLPRFAGEMFGLPASTRLH
jgi:hypothetical protein